MKPKVAQQVSLKQLSRGAIATALFMLIVCLAFLLWVSHSLKGVVKEDVAGNHEKITQSLQSFSNLERFMVLGDRLVITSGAKGRSTIAAEMQALWYHPSIGVVFDTDVQAKDEFSKVTKLLSEISNYANVPDVIGSSSNKISIEELTQVWSDVKRDLEKRSNLISANLINLANQSSTEIERFTERMRWVSIIAVVIGILTIVLFYFAVRSTLYKPLMSISAYLSTLSHGVEPKERLGQANSAEMQQTFDAINNLLDTRKSLDYLSYYDPLTGLLNRKSLMNALENQVQTHANGYQSFAVLYMDLDNFKSVNDTMGHSIGDVFLQLATRRIVNVLNEVDIKARVGGDEFVILLPHISNPNQAKKIADQLITEVSRASTLGELDLSVSGSIGIAIFPEDAQQAEDLLKGAEIAMYHGKSVGRGGAHFFNESMNDLVSSRFQLESDLLRAIKEREFELYYQPQVSEDGQTIHGVEALIRWRSPDGNLMLPSSFIPFAEESGQIIEIGNWVIVEACKTLQSWAQKGITIRMSLNLSARQLYDNHIVDVVQQTLQQTGINPSMLELEITESAAMQSPEVTVTCLNRLKKLGVRLAIDDFGTGYSSLAYLKMFPIDRLKLDRTFVKDLPSNNNDQAIYDMTRGLAGSLSLEMIAEGVERDDQYQYLSTHGCQMYQGFYFSKPLTASEFEAFYHQTQMSQYMLSEV